MRKPDPRQSVRHRKVVHAARKAKGRLAHIRARHFGHYYVAPQFDPA